MPYLLDFMCVGCMYSMSSGIIWSILIKINLSDCMPNGCMCSWSLQKRIEWDCARNVVESWFYVLA